METKSKQRAKDGEIPVEREFRDLQGSHTVKNQIKKAVNSGYKGKSKDKDKSDFSVVEKVIDPKTERLFAKWEKNGVVSRIDGCISAGKEANVYHAVAPDGKELAIKIYKVDTMVFRDREEYIDGEHRFRRGYQRTNAFKLIKVWAEKEYRNLKRIRASGIICPVPLIIKENLIVMEFMGSGGAAAPRLKDVKMTPKQHSQVYLDLIELVKTLWQKCNLVHGDLSPYNVLFDGSRLILIDVSQSVGDDHPLAMEFLKRDLRNLNHYYRHHEVVTFHLPDLFEYVRNKKLTAAEEKEAAVHSMMEAALKRPETHEEEVNFLLSNVPQSLAEIAPERLEQTLEQFKGDWNLVAHAFGLPALESQAENAEDDSEDQQLEGDEEESEEGEEENDEEGKQNPATENEPGEIKEEQSEESEDGIIVAIEAPTNNKSLPVEVTFDGPLQFMDEGVALPEETPKTEEEKKQKADPYEGMSKQERKKKVKEENRVRRQNKMPKKEKKKLMKKSKH